jgi:hypothetical protein
MQLTSDMLTYLPFLLGSLVFILIGGVLLFAPEKFIAAGHWWGRKIGFPEAHYEWKTDSSFTWRNWRLPGLYALCFGLFMLFATVRSLMREAGKTSPTSGTPAVANQHQAHWLAIGFDAIPIALGIFILLSTEKILTKVKNTSSYQVNSNDGLTLARYLFKAIGSLAIIAGLVFLFKHLLSLG